MHPQWLNYLYQYGVGGLMFVASMTTLFKSGAISWERAPDRLLVKGLLIGLFSFMTVHGTWIWMASR